MVSQEIRKVASEIFKLDPQIIHLGLIDLEGHVLIDQSSMSSEPLEPDKDRMMFYYQVGLRRSRREHFNDTYGLTQYVHIVREKMQQLILYLPMITVYLTLDKDLSPERISQIAKKVQNIDKKIPLETIAKNKGLSMPDLFSEMETIVASGTKLNLNYCIEQELDEYEQEDIFDYFRSSQDDDIESALKEFGDRDVSLEQLQMMRIKFMSEYAN